MGRASATVLAIVLCFVCQICQGANTVAPAPSSRSFDLGFIAAQHETITGEQRTTALGPFFEHVTSPDGKSYWGFRPFYARVKDPAHKRDRSFYVWPVGSVTRFMNEVKWRFLLAYGRIGQPGVPASLKYRFSIFPFYFQSRDAAGKTYRALVPFVGTINNFIFWDRLSFVMFPLYFKWQTHDVVSYNYLWPLFGSTESKNEQKVERVRVLPFYAHSVLEGMYEKKSVMWPFWNWARYDSEGSTGYAYMFWPFFGRINRENQKGWMFLPPLFRFDYGKDMENVACPWPFLVYRKTKYMEKLYLWPLWGKRKVGPLTNQFFLWPLIWNRTIQFNKQVVRGFQFIPFIIWDRMIAKKPDGSLGEVTGRFSKIWPLMSYRRSGDVKQLNLIELWPFREDMGVRQSWAPLWTLFSHTSVRGKGYDTELLWGLYRQSRRGSDKLYSSVFPLYSYERDDEVPGGKKEWSFLKGLVGYKRQNGIRRYRLLYFITFGGKEEEQ